MFEVIEGTKKEAINKHDLYYKAYCRVLDSYKNNPDQDTKPLMKKLIVLGVKVINSKKEPETLTPEDVEFYFEYTEIIKAFMANLTPGEFVNLFPITKDYQGHRWQAKDYFYTREYIKQLQQDKPIGEEINNFLWEYTNMEVSIFMDYSMGYMSDLRRLEGLPSIAEEWAEENGIKTYTMHTDSKGKQYLYDADTGKSIKVRKPRPKHLKLVEGR